MKILITGGTGFIGSHVVEHFLGRKDAEIFALVRDVQNLKWLKGLDIVPLAGDIMNIPVLPVDIDYVFHIAGSTKALKAADYYTVNRQGTASLFHSLASQKITPKRIVCLSSLAASGPSNREQPVRESDKPCPVSLYGKSKLEGEREALKFKDRHSIAILRVGVVYGPRDRAFLPYFNLIKKGILASVGTRQNTVSYVYVKDLVNAIATCIHKNIDSGEVVHIANPEPCPFEDFGLAAAKVMHVKLRRIKLPLPLAYMATIASDVAGKISGKPTVFSRQKYAELKQDAWVADTAKARKLLSFHPEYTLNQGMNETIGWYLEQGWL